MFTLISSLIFASPYIAIALYFAISFLVDSILDKRNENHLSIIEAMTEEEYIVYMDKRDNNH